MNLIIRNIGLIFYPGGHVCFKGYAPILRSVAKESGCLVALPQVALNLAFFDINAGLQFLKKGAVTEQKDLSWFLAGHSLGGVAVSLFLKNNFNNGKNPPVDSVANNITGIALWASFPSDSIADLDLPIKALMIYGDRDLTSVDKYDEKKPLLPTDTDYVIIKGGNHAQFADYGLQGGDKSATISNKVQHDIIVNSTVAFIKGNL